MDLMWKYWLLGIILILVFPIIPYDHSEIDGITEVKNKSIAMYVYERYQEIQKTEHDEDAPVAQ